MPLDEDFDRWFMSLLEEGDLDKVCREATVERMNEAGGGGTSNSAVNHPVVLLRSLDADRFDWLSWDSVSDTGIAVSRLPPNLNHGRHLQTVFTAGIPSAPVPVEVACSLVVSDPADVTVDLDQEAIVVMLTEEKLPELLEARGITGFEDLTLAMSVGSPLFAECEQELIGRLNMIAWILALGGIGLILLDVLRERGMLGGAKPKDDD